MLCSRWTNLKQQELEQEDHSFQILPEFPLMPTETILPSLDDFYSQDEGEIFYNCKLESPSQDLSPLDVLLNRVDPIKKMSNPITRTNFKQLLQRQQLEQQDQLFQTQKPSQSDFSQSQSVAVPSLDDFYSQDEGEIFYELESPRTSSPTTVPPDDPSRVLQRNLPYLRRRKQKGMKNWKKLKNLQERKREKELVKTEDETPKGKRKRKKQKVEVEVDKVKDGVVADDDLEGLSFQLGSPWKSLARRLKFSPAEIDGFDHAEKELAEKSFRMLCRWKEKSGLSGATYKVLYEALCHKYVDRKDLAGQFCNA